MTRNLLQLLWFLMPLCGLTAGLIVWPQADASVRWSAGFLLVLGTICWLYLSFRLIGFRIRLFTFLRQLLANDYAAGIRTRTRYTDEVSRLEALANRVSERLQAYDQLRANRVSIHARAFELILDRSPEPLAAIDMQQEEIHFNPAAQASLGIARKRFSFESVLKPEINSELRELFNDATLGRKVQTEGFSWLQLPGMSDPVYVGLQFTPLRDKNEEVCFALLLIKVPSATAKKEDK